MARVRILSVVLRNLRNVAYGKVRFPCDSEDKMFSLKSDILGVYGQNGSGKTTLIDALEILKCLLTGDRLPEHYIDYIAINADRAKLEFEFCIELDDKVKFHATYLVELGKDNLAESLKARIMQNGGWTRSNTIFGCDSADTRIVVTPETMRKSLFGKDPDLLAELRATKIICAKERRSLIFSDETIALMIRGSSITDWSRMIMSMHNFGVTGLFVINNRGNGLISLGLALPFNFRTGDALGAFTLPLDEPTVLAKDAYRLVNQIVDTINVVLREIIPGMELSLYQLGNELLENGAPGVRAQLVRSGVDPGSGKKVDLPLRYESEGIKKIVSILHLFICAYNNPDVTLAVDELDSGIFEYLLGELLKIMQDSGLGQLVFTSHNLHPLETLSPNSIIFTTTNSQNRYVRATNIKGVSNLRLCYYRNITLGGSGEELYQETNSYEIAHAMRKVASPNDT